MNDSYVVPFNFLEHEIRVDSYLCKSGAFIGWKKKHYKKRINKKWRKKYGAVYSACPGVCYRVALPNLSGIPSSGFDGFLMCPCVYKALKEQTK